MVNVTLDGAIYFLFSDYLCYVISKLNYDELKLIKKALAHFHNIDSVSPYLYAYAWNQDKPPAGFAFSEGVEDSPNPVCHELQPRTHLID